MPDDIVPGLDRATAEDLYAALYGAGRPLIGQSGRRLPFLA